MSSEVRQERTINPDTNQPESHLREQVRDALGLAWDARDEAILTKIRELARQNTILTLELRAAALELGRKPA